MGNAMYFSGIDSNDISIDDPTNSRLKLKPDIYYQITSDENLNVRVFLDTHLLDFGKCQDEQVPIPIKLLPKSSASFSIGKMDNMGPIIYITKALTKAEFRKMKPRKFKRNYLAPLDKIIRIKNIECDLSTRYYDYPPGDPINSEKDIQNYFNDRAPPLKRLYKLIYENHSNFGDLKFFGPPFYPTKSIMPDIAHLHNYSNSTNFRFPEACFALGDFKKVIYKLADGFEDLMRAIKDYRKLLSDHRKSGLQKPEPAFDIGTWSEKTAFAFVLRKYLLDSFLCGTDRVYISDHQNFSGFFQYDFIEDQMIINYYIIDDPETVAHGITLRSAEAGFFYKDFSKATATKEKLSLLCEESKKIPGGIDPFGESHTKKSKSELSTLSTIEENANGKEEKIIEGNTNCRVIFDAPECYPNLGINLPAKVFVKLYHYSSRSWEMHDLIYLNTPTKQEYYHIFYNELGINEIIAKSEYASHFPKIIASGYWNGLYECPMHIFEYLGKELPEEKWNKDKVYKVIKTRIQELHSLGISHNDIRIPNIHVSESGKISLIDFGLSDANNNELRKIRDLQLLDELFEVGKYFPKKGNYGHKRNRNKRSEENYPSLLHQNKNRNMENFENEPTLLYQSTDRNNENYGNEPILSNQIQEQMDCNEEEYDIHPLSFHDVDPFVRKGHY